MASHSSDESSCISTSSSESDRCQANFTWYSLREKPTSTGGLLDRIGNGCNIMTHVHAHVTIKAGPHLPARKARKVLNEFG